MLCQYHSFALAKTAETRDKILGNLSNDGGGGNSGFPSKIDVIVKKEDPNAPAPAPESGGGFSFSLEKFSRTSDQSEAAACK